MKCPHCLVEFHDSPKEISVGADVDGGWVLHTRMCPACRRLVVQLVSGPPVQVGQNPAMFTVSQVAATRLVRPLGYARAPVSPAVPRKFVDDYKEACAVFADSPKASAALSRRCLQNILREVAKVKPGNLADEIQQVLDSKSLPGYIAESIDAVRNTGNFAAHPMKSTATGEVLPVEPGEAEWNLDVLESLFDFYFVQPAVLQAKRDALNKKLADAKKPPMK